MADLEISADGVRLRAKDAPKAHRFVTDALLQGVTSREVLEAYLNGFGNSNYLKARAIGIAHDDIMNNRELVDRDYVFLRDKYGLQHDQAVEVVEKLPVGLHASIAYRPARNLYYRFMEKYGRHDEALLAGVLTVELARYCPSGYEKQIPSDYIWEMYLKRPNLMFIARAYLVYVEASGPALITEETVAQLMQQAPST